MDGPDGCPWIAEWNELSKFTLAEFGAVVIFKGYILPRVRLRNIFQVPNHGVCSCITSAQAVEPKELSADIKIVSGVNKSRGIVLTSGDGWRSCSAVDNVVKPRRSLQNVQRDDREGSQSVTWRQWRKN